MLTDLDDGSHVSFVDARQVVITPRTHGHINLCDLSPVGVVVQMEGLLRFKLPQPARSREQAQRRQEIVKEAVRLIKLLSTTSSSPSNLKAAVSGAAADILDSAAAAADAARKTAYTGLLHAVPADDDKQLKGYQDLRTSLELLLKCLRQEVRGARVAQYCMPDTRW